MSVCSGPWTTSKTAFVLLQLSCKRVRKFGKQPLPSYKRPLSFFMLNSAAFSVCLVLSHNTASQLCFQFHSLGFLADSQEIVAKQCHDLFPFCPRFATSAFNPLCPSLVYMIPGQLLHMGNMQSDFPRPSVEDCWTPCQRPVEKMHHCFWVLFFPDDPCVYWVPAACRFVYYSFVIYFDIRKCKGSSVVSVKIRPAVPSHLQFHIHLELIFLFL